MLPFKKTLKRPAFRRFVVPFTFALFALGLVAFVAMTG